MWILGATIANSLVALAGAFTLFCSEKTLDRILFALVGFSAGALLAGAFFHLIIEALEAIGDSMVVFLFVFAGFIVFFLIERVLHWHHCHLGICEVHPMGHLILIGDGIHNFIDGLVIAASFLVSISFGVITTIIIIGHELPQELGDFGVLIQSGFSKKKALFYNFISQVTSVVGGLIGFFFSTSLGFSQFLLPFAAGGFIYIAASDLVPELHKESDLKKSFGAFVFFLLGIGFMVGLKLIFGG